jgi:hypothetical protein
VRLGFARGDDAVAELEFAEVQNVVVEEGEKAQIDVGVFGVRQIAIIRPKAVAFRLGDAEFDRTIRHNSKLSERNSVTPICRPNFETTRSSGSEH